MHCLLQLTAALGMAALLTVSSSDAASWDYGAHGPHHWAHSHPRFCAGAKQSPIDLGIQHSQLNSQIKKFLVVQNTNASDVEFKLTNNGHSIQLTWSDALSIRMGVNASNPTHTAAQMHWHWGSTNQKGSEHTVNKTAFPAEGHLVFYDEKYNNLSYAVDKSLAVLGVFYEVSEKDNPLLKLIEPALTNDSIVLKNGVASVNVKGLNYLDVMSSLFLPTNTDDFYRYEGSLTTPLCFESVTWTVYRQKVPISERQLSMFRRLKFSDNVAAMVDNFRPPLPLNPVPISGTPRVLFRTFEEQTFSPCQTRCSPCPNKATRASITTIVPFLAFAMVAVATQQFTTAAASSAF